VPESVHYVLKSHTAASTMFHIQMTVDDPKTDPQTDRRATPGDAT
jgi:hypothetical protein